MCFVVVVVYVEGLCLLFLRGLGGVWMGRYGGEV